MRALVFSGPAKAEVADVAGVTAPGPGEVIVRSRMVGVCHSDLELLAGRYIIPISYPITPGHEWAGEIAEVGPDVTGFRSGDPVVGECVVGPGGKDHFGFSISAAAGRNASVVLIEPRPDRRAKALELGVTDVIDPTTEDVGERALEINHGDAFNVVIESAGHPDAMAQALTIAGNHGRIVYVGIDVGGKVAAELGLIQAKSLRIAGIVGSAGVWPQAIRFLGSGVIDPSPIVTAKFPLADAVDALGAASLGAGNIKVHIETAA